MAGRKAGPLPPAKKISIADAAKRDIANIKAYSRKRWGARQADKYDAEIKSKLRYLRDAPAIGADCGDLKTGLRSFPVGRHVVFYQDTEAELIVARVLHKQMDAGRHLQ